MARVLYIDHYAGSDRHGMEFRPYYMAREWQRLGHQVTIVAATRSHLRQLNPQVTAPWTEEQVDGIRYIWLDTPAYAGNGLARVRNMLAFVARLYQHAGRLARDYAPEVVIASSTYPFDIFPARSIARRTGARLIFELHDLWPLSPMELGQMSRWHPFILLTQLAEDYVCRHADLVVSMLPKADQHLATRGLKPGKFVYVPNGVVLPQAGEAAAPLPEAHRAELQRQRELGRFVVAYAGAHGLLNNLGLVLEAAGQLRGHPVAFVLVGQGPEKAALAAEATRRQLDNVVFLPAVPKAAVPALLEAADALLLSFAPQPLFRFGVSPNKLMDYMLAGRPVIAAMRAGNNPVAEHGCGVTAPPDDAAALAGEVRRLTGMAPGERQAMGQRGRQAVQDHYAYGVLAARFAACFAPPAP